MRRFSSLFVLLFAFNAHALVLDSKLPNAEQEARARVLFHELRCIVCEGQSLAESDAVFAQQMRSEVRRMIGDGESDEAVKDYFIERYGERILQSPPLNAHTALLWLAPALFLGIAAFLMRRKRSR